MASPSGTEVGRNSFVVFSKKRAGAISPSPSKGSAASVKSYVPNETEAVKKDRKFKGRKHSRWYHLRRRLTKRGVVPVNKDHPRYKLLSCIREGIRIIFKEYPSIEPKDVLRSHDFKDIKSIKVEFEETEFEFESYASTVFATIRRAIGIDEEDYASSVAPNNLPYMEFISNSKSGQDFFLSHDMQYMFKSNRKRDVDFFLSITRDYLQHFVAYPHSLLVKYIGCYAIKLKGKKKKYFLVMQSIFYPAERIEDRFDIKGCTAGRYQKPSHPSSNIITVLKDQNFFREHLDLGDQGEWFMQQIRADSDFLCKFNCMDYSLLIGRQKRHPDEQKPSNFQTVVKRIAISISPVSNESKHHRSSMSTESDQERPESQLSRNGPSFSDGALSVSVINPKLSSDFVFPRNLVGSIERFQDEHRRLLPHCRNRLHILDGPEYRYFFGIVDFLTRFDWRQKTAQYWKMVKYGCGDHSTKRPDVYSRRFVDFLSSRVRGQDDIV